MKYKFLISIFTILLFSGCGLLTKEAVLDARKDIVAGAYKNAVESLEKVESDMADLNENQKAEVLFLKGSALQNLDRFEEANEYFNIIINKYPSSAFSAQAKVLRNKSDIK